MFQALCARAPLMEQIMVRGDSVLQVSNGAIGASSSGQDKGRKPWSAWKSYIGNGTLAEARL